MEVTKANLNAEFTSPALSTSRSASSNLETSPTQSVARTSNDTKAMNEEQQKSLNEQIKQVTEKLNEQAQKIDANVRFGYSNKLSTLYVSVTEKNTGREIRQIPTEEAMRLAEHFKDVIGMIFNKEI